MKNTAVLLYSFLLFGLVSTIYAQETVYTITNSTIDFKGDRQSCVHVEIDPGIKATKDAWEDFLKKNYDIKMKGKYDMVAKEVLFAKLSPEPINFHTIITGDDSFSQIDLMLAFDKKAFARPETNPTEFANMKQLLDEFLPGFLQKYYVSESKANAKIFKKIKKKNKKLLKANKKLTKKVQKNQKARESLNKADQSSSEGIAAITEVIARLQEENQQMEQQIQDNSTAINANKETQLQAKNKLDYAVSKLKLLKKK
ncbi:MAG: hypothetical protein K9H64_21745 [Bacteroidales bacterium]|nr:hypothetical protein [Bacteroidales bacterium]MCF8458635.1 hypothetical protein [Bacteroidales bacterium]